MPASLQRITCPVQGIWGGRDPLRRAGVQERIDTCLRIRPDMRVHVEPEAGHWVQYEAAGTVNKVLLEFLP